ncbi:MAG: hypothetical protein SCM11_03665 [Bacillota bacterium]|nr:hypothetical protein [Bacillota bacterium]
MFLNKHLFLLTLLVISLSLWLSATAVLRNGTDLSLLTIREDGDASLLSSIVMTGDMTDPNQMDASFVQRFTVGGQPFGVLSTVQEPLSVRQLAYLDRNDHSNGLSSFRGNLHTYRLVSGNMMIRGQSDILTIERYGHDYQAHTVVQLPVTARIPGRAYNAWEVSDSLVTSPFAEIDGLTYLIIPADSRVRGTSTLFRIESWSKWPGDRDIETVLANADNVYTALADIPLNEGMNLCGLYAYGQELILIASESVTSYENGRAVEEGRFLLINRYSLDGRLLHQDRFAADFYRIQDACLAGDTLTLVTNGQSLSAHVFTLGSRTIRWGQVDLQYDNNVMMLGHLPFSFRLVGGKLYQAATIIQNPVVREDEWSASYADGTIMESHSNWGVRVQRQAILTAVYEADGTCLYRGYHDPGLNQDLAYKRSPAWHPANSESLSERNIIRIDISPATPDNR